MLVGDEMSLERIFPTEALAADGAGVWLVSRVGEKMTAQMLTPVEGLSAVRTDLFGDLRWRRHLCGPCRCLSS